MSDAPRAARSPPDSGAERIACLCFDWSEEAAEERSCGERGAVSWHGRMPASVSIIDEKAGGGGRSGEDADGI